MQECLKKTGIERKERCEWHACPEENKKQKWNEQQCRRNLNSTKQLKNQQMEMKMKNKTHLNLNNIKKDHAQVIVSNIFLFVCKKKLLKDTSKAFMQFMEPGKELIKSLCYSLIMLQCTRERYNRSQNLTIKRLTIIDFVWSQL